MEQNDGLNDGRVPTEPGSREPSQQAVSAASGFDPSRFADQLLAWAKYYEGEAERLQNVKSDFLNTAAMTLRAVAAATNHASAA